jgi:hypothetical protein
MGLLARVIGFGDYLAEMDSPLVADPNFLPQIGAEFLGLQKLLFAWLAGSGFWWTAVGAGAKGASLGVLAHNMAKSHVWDARFLSVEKSHVLAWHR